MKGLFFIMVAAFFWGSDGLLRYPLLSSGKIHAETIVFYEHLILTLVFVPLSSFSSERGLPWKSFLTLPLRPSRHLFYFLVIGAGGAALATVCYTRAFSLINPSLVILLQKLQPLVAILLAGWFLREPISKEFILWALVCLAGAFLISFHDLEKIWGLSASSSQGLGDTLFEEGSLKGYLYALAAVVGWGASTVFGKKLTLAGYGTTQIMQGRYIVALAVLTPLMLGKGHSFAISSPHFFQISLMAAVSGLFGIYFYYRGLRLVSAKVCTLGELFFPLAAVFFNWVFLDLSVHPLQLVGGGMLLIGAFMVQIKRY
ncbi:MAG: DMT family transporter [Bacteriovoracales bacterium]|nr:DMT family transporter [Bacteriovoracales bacterium]